MESASHVKQLVLQLYGFQGPPRPEEVQTINETLTQLQSDPPAGLVETLIQDDAPQVRFFAAVLLNSQASKGGGNDVDQKDRFLQYLDYAIRSSFGMLEYTKLCSAVGTLYVTLGGWPDLIEAFESRCLPELAPSLGKSTISSSLDSIDDGRLLALLVLAESVSVEVDRSAASQEQRWAVERSFKATACSLLPILTTMLERRRLTNHRCSPLRVIATILNCDAFSGPKDVRLESQLGSVAEGVLGILINGPVTPLMFEALHLALEAILQTKSSLVSKRSWQNLVISLGHASECLKYVHGSDESLTDASAISGARQLLLSVSWQILERQEFFESPVDDAFEESRTLLFEALCTSFYISDDSGAWSSQLLSFWDEYLVSATEALNDQVEGRLNISRNVRLHVIQIINVLLSRLGAPTDADDNNGIEALSVLHEESKDVLEDAYVFFQRLSEVSDGSDLSLQGETPLHSVPSQPNELLRMLKEPAFRATPATLEIVLRSLIAVSDVASKNPNNDVVVQEILQSSAFELTQSSDSAAESSTSYLSADLIGSYSAFFKRNSTVLVEAISFLFNLTKSSNAKTQKSAARSIARLCETCCHELTPRIEDLLHGFASLMSQLTKLTTIGESVSRGIASVAWACDREHSDLTATTNVIVIVENSTKAWLSLTVSAQDSASRDAITAVGVSILNCLHSIGHASQSGVGASNAIDLEDDENRSGKRVNPQAQIGLQMKLTSCISAVVSNELMKDSEDGMRALWAILRLKLRQGSLEIFSFPSSLYVEVLQTCLAGSLAIDESMQTFSLMLRSRRLTEDSDHTRAIQDAFTALLNFISARVHNDQDPDGAASAVDLLGTYVQTNKELVRASSGFPAAVTAVSQMLSAAESLAKSAACQFWTTLLADTSGLASLLSAAHLHDLVFRLCEQLSGAAAKQDLDALADLVGALTIQAGQVRASFEQAFQALEHGGRNIPEWQRLLAQVFTLRGRKRETRNVVRSFWQQSSIRSSEGERPDVDAIELD